MYVCRRESTGTGRCREQYRSPMQMQQADIANGYLAAGLPSPKFKNKKQPQEKSCAQSKQQCIRIFKRCDPQAEARDPRHSLEALTVTSCAIILYSISIPERARPGKKVKANKSFGCLDACASPVRCAAPNKKPFKKY
jgi:hypothetical protein